LDAKVVCARDPGHRRADVGVQRSTVCATADTGSVVDRRRDFLDGPGDETGGIDVRRSAATTASGVVRRLQIVIGSTASTTTEIARTARSARTAAAGDKGVLVALAASTAKRTRSGSAVLGASFFGDAASTGRVESSITGAPVAACGSVLRIPARRSRSVSVDTADSSEHASARRQTGVAAFAADSRPEVVGVVAFATTAAGKHFDHTSKADSNGVTASAASVVVSLPFAASKARDLNDLSWRHAVGRAHGSAIASGAAAANVFTCTTSCFQSGSTDPIGNGCRQRCRVVRRRPRGVDGRVGRNP